METAKIKSSIIIYTSENITELNELIYPVAKLFCEKIGVPLKGTNKKSKPGCKIRLETQIKKKRIRKQTKTIKQRKNVEICWDKKKQHKKKKNNST